MSAAGLVSAAERPEFLDPAFRAAVKDAAEARKQRVSERASTAAKQRRARSRSAFRGRMGGDAVALARQKFAGVLQSPVFFGKRQFGARAEEFLNDHTLMVDNGEGQPKGLVQSSIPMRVRRDGQNAAVDLELEEAPDAFRPRSPLVDIRLGRRPGDALGLVGSGVNVQIASEPSASAANVVGDRVFFADVAADTDAWVAPAAFGAEVFWQLRSPASPERLGLKLQLPPGATASLVRPPTRPGAPLDASKSDAAVEIRHGSELLAKVAPPFAFDADDEPVDVHYELRGNEIEVVVRHRDADLEYPVLVDPYVYDQYGFGDTNFQGGWGAESNKGDHFWWDTYHAAVDWGYGLHIGQHGGLYYTGEYANYSNWAPGQTSYIYGLEMQGVHHRMPDPQNLTQNFYSGLTDAGGWQSLFNQNFTFYWGHRGHCADGRATGNNWPGNPAFCDASPRPHNRATFGAWINDYGWRTSQGHMIVRDTRMYMSDPEAPSGVSVSNLPTSDWRDDATYTSNVSASDPGLGIRNLYVVRADTGAVLGSHHQGTGSCGNRYSRCAGSGTWPVTYGTSSLPEGLNRLRGRATDAVEHSSDASGAFDVRVDRSKPKLSAPQGTLYAARNRTDDHRFEGVYGDSYTLTATASDDFSGLRDVEVFMTRAGGTRESQRSRGGYSTNGTLNWTMRPDDYADGDYTIEVVARDNLQGTAGAPDSRHLEAQSFPVTIDRRGDVYNGLHYDGDPATGEALLEREWLRFGTRNGRSESDEDLLTRRTEPCPSDSSRTCDVVRQRTYFSDAGSADPSAPDAYDVAEGAPDDPSLPNVLRLRVADEVEGDPAATGSLLDVTRTWQTLPPARGTRFERYDLSANRRTSDPPPESSAEEAEGHGPASQGQMTLQIYLERQTRLPVRLRTVASDGEVVAETFWTYSRSRTQVGDHPADFFATPAPSSQDGPRTDTEQRGQQPAASVQDRESGQTFQPQYLGKAISQANVGPLCLKSNDVIVHRGLLLAESQVDVDDSDAAVPTAIPGGRTETLVSAAYELAPDLSACNGLAFVNANKSQFDLTVVSMRRASATAQAWRTAFEEDARMSQADLDDPDAASAGLQPVTFNLMPQIAYLVPAAGGGTSAYLEIGNASIILTGPFTEQTLQSIVDNLRGQ